MGNRRRAREVAMQALYYMDKSRGDREEMFELFCRSFPPSKKMHLFFTKLVDGVLSSRPEIDLIIEGHSSNWKIGRMACVDRNILRIAVYELLWCGDIPAKVTINEAIDIGKKFGTEESGSFINGILDSIRIALNEGKIQEKTDFQVH